MGLGAAWLVGLGIVTWREVRGSGHMPVPAALLGVTGLFAALSLVADISPKARPVVTLGAWGLDIAGLLNILPGGLYGQIEKTQKTEAAAEAGRPGGFEGGGSPVLGGPRGTPA